MSNLTTEQLAELMKRVTARIDEFDGALAIDPLPSGIVRLIYDEIETWMARTDYAGDDGIEDDAWESNPLRLWPAAPDPARGDPMMDGYHVGYERGFRAAVSELDRAKDNGWSIEHDESGRPRERTPWEDVLLPGGVNEQSIETKASVVRLYCPCGGEMLPTGMLLMSHPAKVSHRCEVCGMETHSFLSYPHVTFKTGDEEAARQAVPVTDEPQGDPPPLNYDVPDLEAEGKAAKAAIEAVAARTMAPRKCDEKSTAAETPAAPTAPAAPRQRTQEAKPPDPDAARDKIAHALAAGSNGTLATAINRPRTLAEVDDADKDDAAGDAGGKRGRPPKFVVPTRAQVITQLKQIAMGGVMPKQPAYDMAKPANWPTARDSCIHLEASWRELADEAGLDPYRGL